MSFSDMLVGGFLGYSLHPDSGLDKAALMQRLNSMSQRMIYLALQNALRKHSSVVDQSGCSAKCFLMTLRLVSWEIDISKLDLNDRSDAEFADAVELFQEQLDDLIAKCG